MHTPISQNDHLTEHDRLTPERLVRLVDREASSLAEQLAGARSKHGLTWSALLSAQDEIARLDKSGTTPTIEEFWVATAEPMAQPLLDVCIDAIANAYSTAAAGVSRVERGSTEQDAALGRRIAEIWSSVSFDQDELNDLGGRWQKRLSRRAARSAFLRSMMRPASEYSAHLELTEMTLLDRPPWRHGDRILTAFELVHGDVRAALRQAQHDLAAPLIERPRGVKRVTRVASEHPGQ